MKKGQKLAGTRIIPLVIEQEKMDAMQAAGRQRTHPERAAFPPA